MARESAALSLGGSSKNPMTAANLPVEVTRPRRASVQGLLISSSLVDRLILKLSFLMYDSSQASSMTFSLEGHCPGVSEGVCQIASPVPAFAGMTRVEGRNDAGECGAGLSLGIRVEGLAVYEHVLDYGVAVVVNADHHPHVLRALYDAAGPFGHEIRANAKVETAPVVDAALDEYFSVEIARDQTE